MTTNDVTVVLRLVDGITGPGKKAAEALRSILKTANDLKKIDVGGKLAGDLKGTQAQIRAMSADIRQFSSAFRSAMDGARGMSKQLASGGGMFGADLRNMKELAKIQGQMLREQRRMLEPRGRAGLGYGYGGFAAGYYGHRIAHGARAAMDKGGQLDSQLAMLDVAGFAPAVKQKMIAAAQAVIKEVPTLTEADALGGLREVGFAAGNMDKAIKFLPLLAKADAVIASSKLGEEGGKRFHSQMMELTKSAEMKSYIVDDEAMKHFVNMSTKQAIASGGLVTPEMTFSSLKYFRSGLHGVNRDFIDYYLPELNQELMKGKGAGQGGAAGNPLESWITTTGAGRMTKQAKAAWSAAGLMGADGKPLEHMLALANPKAWSDKVILPWLQKQGIDPFNEADHAKVVDKLSGLYENRTARQIAQLMVIQSKQMEERRKFIEQSLDLDQAHARIMATWKNSTWMLGKQADQFLASVTQPFMKPAIDAVRSFGKMFAGLGEWARANPAMVQGIAGLAGFGALSLLRAVGLRSLMPFIGGGIGALAGGPMGGALGMIAGRSMFGAAGTAAGATFATGFASSFLAMLSRTIGATALISALMGIKSDSNDPKHELRSSVRAALGIDDGKIGTQTWNGKSWIKGSIFDPKDDIKNKWQPGSVWEVLGGKRFTAIPFLQFLPKDSGKAASGYGGVNFGTLGTFNGDWGSNPNPVGDKAKAQSEGTNWGQIFLDAVKSIINNAIVPGPHVDLPGGGWPGGSSGRGGHPQNINIHVHGSSDPRGVADAVHAKFRSAMQRQLSDGAYAI